MPTLYEFLDEIGCSADFADVCENLKGHNEELADYGVRAEDGRLVTADWEVADEVSWWLCHSVQGFIDIENEGNKVIVTVEKEDK